jgi:predicted nucleotide-binding protein
VAVEEAVERARIAFSGSWIGYHSRVYYTNLDAPPAGAHFSKEWGFINTFDNYGTSGRWEEYQPEALKKILLDLAGNPDLKEIEALSEGASDSFESAKSEILSILHSNSRIANDPIVKKAISRIEEASEVAPAEAVRAIAPRGNSMTRDSLAFTQGQMTPPHIELGTTMLSLRSPFMAAEFVAKECKKVASHIRRLSRASHQQNTQGNMIFIGHGQSSLWRELKDFISDRLHLDWDEFNRIPVAGITNISRLSDMLSTASFALIVLTGEDERTDGAMQARMNVIHEAGLFQGRLGFNKAIILLEDGCEEFSNIQGLSQIRFPAGNISAVFEEIRATLERERLISSR